MNSRGFSLVEVMITLLITSIMFGLVSYNFKNLKRLASRFNEQTAFREQYLIFLLKFEEDFQRSEVKTEEDVVNLDLLIFQIDQNLDGDYEDSAELLAYRWNSQKYRIDRKSGNGNYQSFLEGVKHLSWQKTNMNPLCYRLVVQDYFTELGKTTDFCRPSP